MLGIAVSQPFKGILHKEYEGFEGRVLDALSNLDLEFDLHFYSFDRRNEGAIADDWTGSHSRSFYDPIRSDAVEHFVRAIGESDIFLTSRLHGVILSARIGIPFVSIGVPGEKVEREARALESSSHLPYSSDPSDIVETVRNAWASRRQTANRLSQAVFNQEALAEKTLAALYSCA